MKRLRVPLFLRSPFGPGEPVRRWVRRFLVLATIIVVAPTIYEGRADGQAHVARGGVVGIQNQTERDLFFSLICQCGCPRETLGTCTCDYASARRSELREALEAGTSVQAIQKGYAKRFGTQSLAVPPNEGAGALIWAFPLVAFIVAAIVIARLLKRWTGRGAAQVAQAAASGGGSAKAAPVESAASRDEYDKRLDDELKDLDRE